MSSNFSKKGCRGCYACVRVCPVDAIVIKGGQADILMDRCILCGRCSKACPQHYRVEKTSINSVKNFIKSGETVKSQQYLDILDLHMLKIPVLQQNLFLIYTMHMQMKKIMKTTLHLCVLL